MQQRNALRGCICAAALFAAAAASADHIIEEADLQRGEIELAALSHWNVDHRADVDGTAAVETAISRAWSDRLALGLGSSAARSADGSMTGEAVKLAAITRLGGEVNAPWVWGAIIEYAHSLQSGAADEIEVGAIVQRMADGWNLVTNLKAVRSLGDGSDADWEANLHYTRTVRAALDLGIEAFDSPGDGDARERQLGPCLHFGFQWGERAVEIAAAGLFGASDSAPDTMLRLMVAVSH